MKILFTANRLPYPPHRGDKLKIYHLARQLAPRHELHLVTFLQDQNDRQYLPELKKLFKEIHLIPLPKIQCYLNSLLGIFKSTPVQVAYFRSAAMREKIAELAARGDFDVVHVQHLRMAQYWSDYQSIPRILDLPDAYSLYWKRRVAARQGLLKWIAGVEQRKVAAYESILNDFDRALVCSREDQAWLQKERGINNVSLLPNGVDLATFSHSHDYSLSDAILFTGNMDYAPNVDAVVYFCDAILPLIRQKLPHVRFVIAGQRPVKKVRALADDVVTVTGFVPDLSVYYRQAAIVVAPLRFGAGTQNKVLEAMAMGVPVVSRDIGFNGLNIESGEGVFLAKSPTLFADTCIGLLTDPALRAATGQAGRQVIQSQFDWPVIARKLEGYFEAVVAASEERKD